MLCAHTLSCFPALYLLRVKKVSVCLMIVHQLAAFAYYVVPLMFMWERVIGTHNKPWWVGGFTRRSWLQCSSLAHMFESMQTAACQDINPPWHAVWCQCSCSLHQHC